MVIWRLRLFTKNYVFTNNSRREANAHGRGLAQWACGWFARPLRRCGGFKMAEALTTQEQLVRRSSRCFFFNQSCLDQVNSACFSPYFFVVHHVFFIFFLEIWMFLEEMFSKQLWPFPTLTNRLTLVWLTAFSMHISTMAFASIRDPFTGCERQIHTS